jgi:hypothetical protein
MKFVLSWRPRDKMATKRGSFPALNPEREVAKPVFECGGSGCCIISDKGKILLLSSGGVPSIKDGLTFGVADKGFRQGIWVSEDIQALMLRF